ncbi:hypothetical protein BC830DRAFT_121398 [Chytriomyces sp. MP71]|nr:hypothetical protein BC830DRAFT_121398 [Chytriomyces sp. MP71]
MKPLNLLLPTAAATGGCVTMLAIWTRTLGIAFGAGIDEYSNSNTALQQDSQCTLFILFHTVYGGNNAIACFPRNPERVSCLRENLILNTLTSLHYNVNRDALVKPNNVWMPELEQNAAFCFRTFGHIRFPFCELQVLKTMLRGSSQIGQLRKMHSVHARVHRISCVFCE